MKPTAHETPGLKEAGRRMTRQRRLILEVLRGTTSHPDAYWVYERVRQHLPNISLGTVYRTLGVFRDLGLVLELPSATGFSRYDGRTDPHHHIHCVRCGRIADVELSMGDPARHAAIPEGFRVLSYEVVWRGICAPCQERDPHKTAKKQERR